MYFTVPPNGVAKLHFGAHFQAPGLPNQTAGTVDVYGLQILDATLETGNAVEAEEHTAASPAEARVPRRRGRRRHVGHPGQGAAGAHAHHARQLPVRSNSQSSVASELEGYAMTLSLRLEHRAHLHADAGETLLLRLPVQAGHLQLGDVRQRGRQRLRGRHRHLPRHARRASGARRAWTSRCRRAESRSCTSEPSAARSPGWCSSRRARWTCTACRSGPAPLSVERVSLFRGGFPNGLYCT